MIKDAITKEIANRIAWYAVSYELNPHEILTQLGALNWDAVLEDELTRRARDQEARENEEVECPRCFRVIKRKELLHFDSRTHSSATPRIINVVCPTCFREIEEEFFREYRRSCLICEAFFFVKRSYSENQVFCDKHNGIKNQKEAIRVASQNRRTQSLGLVSDLTVIEWLEIIQKYDDKCAYCGGEWSDMDHVVAVSRGGGTTRENVVPACQTCNNEKRTRNIVPLNVRS